MKSNLYKDIALGFKNVEGRVISFLSAKCCYIYPMSLTLIIVIITAGISLLAENNANLREKLLFNPYQIKHHREFHRWISHGFIHSGLMHLAVNMYVLYNFGEFVEMNFTSYFGNSGPYYFLILYLGGIIVSSIAAYKKHQDNPNYNSLGASGAVASVLFSFIIFQPTWDLYLMFIPIGIPAFILGGLYLWYEQYMGKRGGTGIAHDAHFWGAIYGVVFTVALGPALIQHFIQSISIWFQAIIS